MRRPTYLEPFAYLVVGSAAILIFDAHAVFWVVVISLFGKLTFETFRERRRATGSSSPHVHE